MLKQGRMVDAGSPAALLEKYGRDDMEQVFLDIARGRSRQAVAGMSASIGRPPGDAARGCCGAYWGLVTGTWRSTAGPGRGCWS